MSSIFSLPCRFIAGAAVPEQLPATPYPEIAFVGRSNVGKSSLINALVGQKIAHASNTPGRTRQINFFLLANQLMLVDLPGYGYAKASKKDVENWTKLMHDYLKYRSQLVRVCILIDARQGVRASDKEMMEILDASAVSFQLVITKQDKVKQNEIDQITSSMPLWAKTYTALHPEWAVTSADKRIGINELKRTLEHVAASVGINKG